MSQATFIVGDTRDVTATMPDGSVDLILTSPPFLALRSYLPADHPNKHREIGSEPTPAAFIDMLLALTAEWRRVLAPHGSICVELGDTYSGTATRGNGPDARNPAARLAMVNNRRDTTGYPLDKSKCLIPELYRIGLAYGINPLTGQPSPAGRWRVRNTITWCRPNPPVGALGDKFRPATSDMVVATVASDRYFDLDAVRGPASENTHARIAKNGTPRTDLPSRQRDGNWSTLPETDASNPAGAPPLDYWVVPPTGYEGSHYAVYPPELCVKPILAMCPQRVCRVCGQPSRRIVECEPGMGGYHQAFDGGGPTPGGRTERKATTLGWSDCGHNDWRPGLTFDPFAGSGTTLMVATGHGRDAIGIDIDPRNADLARERVGMFLSVEEHQEPEVVGG